MCSKHVQPPKQHLLTSRRFRRICSKIFAGSVCIFLSVLPAASSSATPSVVSKPYTKIGILTIPALRVTSPIYLGITDDVFDKGVGQWPGSARPGRFGNLVLGAHRTSSPRPFSNIDSLRGGDFIFISVGTKRYKYVVTGHSIVKPTSMWITDPTRSATLTLFSCHPKGSVKSRYVVRAVLTT